jgi:cysteate synthase
VTPDAHWLRCEGCSATYPDDGLRLTCDQAHEPALLTSRYREAAFVLDGEASGLFRYRSWLPCSGPVDGEGAPATVTYRSEDLNRALRLPNLWIAFNGFWPERGAACETATFKDLEASAVLARLPAGSDRILVVASAGNTAAAFARACSRELVACVIVLPESGLPALALASPLDPCVRLVALGRGCDYTDAIRLADHLADTPGFLAEGGTKNVGRRDALGTVLLNAVETIGELPRDYFQAVGSGAGGIAAYEAAIRLVADGRFGRRLPRLMLSQNLPFAPIAASWRRRQRTLAELPDAKARLGRIKATALSNRQPAYSPAGGLFDALKATGGEMLGVHNHELDSAARLFRETEGIDVEPESAVALASLIKARAEGRVDGRSSILLNVTGGGRSRRIDDDDGPPVRADLELGEADLELDGARELVLSLFGDGLPTPNGRSTEGAATP